MEELRKWDVSFSNMAIRSITSFAISGVTWKLKASSRVSREAASVLDRWDERFGDSGLAARMRTEKCRDEFGKRFISRGEERGQEERRTGGEVNERKRLYITTDFITTEQFDWYGIAWHGTTFPDSA